MRGTHSPNTPDLAGYLLAVTLAFVVCGSLLVVPEWASGDIHRVVAAVLFLPVSVYVVGLVGAPVALVGVLVAHGLCSKVRSQSVHVAVAALIGLLLGAAYQPVVAAGAMNWWNPVAVGISAAVGRAAVIPLVSRRRDQSPFEPSQ